MQFIGVNNIVFFKWKMDQGIYDDYLVFPNLPIGWKLSMFFII